MSTRQKEMFAESARCGVTSSRFHRIKLVFELLRHNCFQVIRYEARSFWLFAN